MNNNDPYAAQFIASINNPQSAPVSPAPTTDHPSRKKLILIIIAILAVIFIVVIAVALIGGRGSSIKSVHTGVSVMAVPVKSTVEINGKKYQNGTYALEPGKYTAKISAEGFESKTVDFEVSSVKLTTLAAYLQPNGGEYSEEDYDLLRFISDSEETDAAIESFLLGKDINYVFPSAKNGILSIDAVPLGEKYTSYSKKIISETVSAYFYYAHPDIEKIESITDNEDGKSLSIAIDKEQNYLVSFAANEDETSGKDNRKSHIWYVSIQKYGNDDKVFWSDGSYIFDYSGVITDKNDTSSTNFE